MGAPESGLQPLGPGLYVWPGNYRLVQPWLGVVVTTTATVLIDGGNGPKQAAALQAALAAHGAPPVSHILLTHHHWDHVFGCAYFPGARIIAHELTQKHLQVMAGEPWSADYVRAKGGTFANGDIVAAMMCRAVPDWSDFQVLPAHETFSGRYTLALAGATLTMAHVGGQHEPDQCVVHVQPANVLFLGDAGYGRGPEAGWDWAGLAAALAAMEAWGAASYVESHRAPMTAVQFATHIEQLRQRAARPAQR